MGGGPGRQGLQPVVNRVREAVLVAKQVPVKPPGVRVRVLAERARDDLVEALGIWLIVD